MALEDYPVMGEQPNHFRFEIVRDMCTDDLLLWDNDEACIVPGGRASYACKLNLFKLQRKLDNNEIPITWAAYTHA
jgi:hypothetical protein